MRRPASALAAVVLLLGALPAGADTAVARQTELPPYSLLDGDALGGGRLAFGFGAGFPYVQAMAGYGAIDGLDIDLNIDSLYGLVTVLSLGPKVRLLHGDGFALAIEVQGQAAWFRQPETSDLGSRQLTGVRNYDLEPQLILSYRARYGSVFAAVSYQGTFDTEPVSAGPLAGTPPAWTYGSNLGAHLGLEFAAFGLVHPYAVIGLDVHTRSGDDPVMLLAEFGFAFPS